MLFMKPLYFALCLLLSSRLWSLDYEVQFENEQISVVKAKIMSQEVSWAHRDAHPHVVVALSGGAITRLEADGTETLVEFPTGVAVFRPADPPDDLHTSVNRGPEPVELIIIELKG